MKRTGFVIFVVAVYLFSHYILSCKDLKLLRIYGQWKRY